MHFLKALKVESSPESLQQRGFTFVQGAWHWKFDKKLHNL